MIDAANWLFLLLQIFFVDLMLGADNAVVIALACRRLPPEDTRRAVFLGAAGAIALRLVMLLFVNALLSVPLVKLAGAWMLMVIALNVRVQTQDDDAGALRRAGAARDFLSAAAIIMIADATMSLDNVVALAAIAGGAFWLLALGVLFSIPIVAYGALILSAIIRRAPEIIAIGAAFLGWIAGAMAVSDPLVADWVRTQAPALAVFVPALLAVFILLAGERPVEEARLATSPAAPLSPGRESPRPPRRRPGQTAAPTPPPDREAQPEEVFAPAALLEDRPRNLELTGSAESGGLWTEERMVIAGFLLLAIVAGLIIFIASFFDSLT
jgi:YjbE family integral membrane protein